MFLQGLVIGTFIGAVLMFISFIIAQKIRNVN